MMIRSLAIRIALAGAFCALVPSAPTAHHSHNNLDREDIRVWSGVVTAYTWAMPHVFLRIEAPTASGELAEHTIELLHPPAMAEKGWTPDTVHVGDRVTWEGAADRNPNRHFTSLNWLQFSDGRRITMSVGDSPQGASPSTDFSGLWNRSSSFGSTYAPPDNLPLTDVGRALYEAFDPAANPQLECIEPGPPRATIVPYPIRISWPDAGHMVMEYEMRPEPRTVYVGSAPEPGPSSVMGYSVGHWEGDELVVETDHFVPDRWGIHAGIDSSAGKRMVERFSLSDDGLVLNIRIEVSDPVYLSEPYVMEYAMDKMIDRPLLDVPCSTEGARLFLTGYTDN